MTGVVVSSSAVYGKFESGEVSSNQVGSSRSIETVSLSLLRMIVTSFSERFRTLKGPW